MNFTIQFLTEENKIKTLDDLKIGTFEKNFLTSQLKNAKNDLNKAARIVNQVLCYPDIEPVKAFIVTNSRKQSKRAIATQYQHINDYNDIWCQF
jgi:oligoribonuclease (3'-5' exoribonuclease)